MNKYIVTLLAVAITGLNLNAQTNVALSSPVTVEDAGKESGQWEITLGGGGTELNGESVFGMDFSISTNPLKFRPEVWVGLAQGLYWEPSFAGSSDLFIDWSQAILPTKFDDRLYLNVGWSGGALYDTQELYQWRTGPEATLQYYPADSVFIYAGVNYDVWVSQGDKGGWRYGFGIGMSL